MTRALVAIVLALALSGGRVVAQPTMKETPEGVSRPRDPDPRDHGPETADRRAIYVAGGVIVLAMIFLWNRRRRSELDRESEDQTRRNRERTRAARGTEPEPTEVVAADAPDVVTPPDDDDDAADLREAARRSDEEPT